MDLGDGADLAALGEGLEQLRVVQLPQVLVRHEHLERVDAVVGAQLLHFALHLAGRRRLFADYCAHRCFYRWCFWLLLLLLRLTVWAFQFQLETAVNGFDRLLLGSRLLSVGAIKSVS